MLAAPETRGDPTSPLSELRGPLHSLPDTLELIPYRNSYFKEDWGFCLSDRQLQGLPEVI